MTTVLRLPGIYGEGDRVFVSQFLTSCVSAFWFMGDPPTQQIIYVGNAAWSHLCAMKALGENPLAVAGEVFSATDDTPPGSYSALCHPFAASVSHAYVEMPYRLVLYVLYLTQLVLSIVRVFVEVNLMFTPQVFKFIGMKVTFSGKKLRKRCSFKPIFTYQESLRNSSKYYRTVINDPSRYAFGGWSIFRIVSWIQGRYRMVQSLLQDVVLYLFIQMSEKLQ